MQVTNNLGFDQKTYETILKHQDVICEKALQKVAEDFRKEQETNKPVNNDGSIPNDCSVVYTFTYQNIVMPFYVRPQRVLYTNDPYLIKPPAYHATQQYHELFKKIFSRVVKTMIQSPNYMYLTDLIIGIEEPNSSNDSGVYAKTRRMQLVKNPTDQKLFVEIIKSLMKSRILQNATSLAMKPYEVQEIK